jgi:hypothetical protein
MNEFIEGRARLIRMLAHKADPFTKDRLLKLAERYDAQLGLGIEACKSPRNTDWPSQDKRRK